MYTTIQLYELPSISQKDLFYQNPMENQFCGVGWTNLMGTMSCNSGYWMNIFFLCRPCLFVAHETVRKLF